MEQEGEDKDDDTGAEGISWTGWRIYILPTFEDGVAATAVQPFPAPER